MNTTVITTLNVTGMTCGHCEKAVERAIKQLDPAAEVKAEGWAWVDATPGVTHADLHAFRRAPSVLS